MESEEKYKDQPQILVVDDNPTNLKVLGSMLEENNFHVRISTKGKHALSSAKAELPDLVLLDIMMPEMDGYEVCENFKSDSVLKDVPIIFISAKVEAIDKVKAFASGGVDYITKPFQVEEVIERVQTHLQLRAAQNELLKKNALLQKTLDDLQKTQARLVHSAKMASLGVLVAGIAHEINNPVNSINSSCVSLRRISNRMNSLFSAYNELSPENVSAQLLKIAELKKQVDYENLVAGMDELLQIITNGAARTANIVKGLKIFSYSGQDELSNMNLHEIIDSTLSLLKNRYKGMITIHREYGKIDVIRAFPGKLNQVFMNVLTNAVEAILNDDSANQNQQISGEIFIKTRIKKVKKIMQVVIEITDTGRGVPCEVQDKMFDPFFTTKDVGKGTGLGLPISLGIIQDHGGNMSVKSELGKGTIVRICFPLNKPDKAFKVEK